MIYLGENIFYDELVADDCFYLKNEERVYFERLEPRIADYNICNVMCRYCYPRKADTDVKGKDRKQYNRERMNRFNKLKRKFGCYE